MKISGVIFADDKKIILYQCLQCGAKEEVLENTKETHRAEDNKNKIQKIKT